MTLNKIFSALSMQDVEIQEQIERDVARTHPDMHFFSGAADYRLKACNDCCTGFVASQLMMACACASLGRSHAQTACICVDCHANQLALGWADNADPAHPPTHPPGGRPLGSGS